jgi:hypothetical protein
MAFARPYSLLLASFAASPAYAATQGVLFEATIAPICTLTVGDNGQMAASPDLQTLSSKLGGGDSGSVTLSTTGGVSLSVDPVTVVTAPAGDTSPTTWSPTYAVTGSHNIAERSAPQALGGPGSSTVTVHLVGTKGGSDTFAAGDYEATVTVRCE